MLTLLLLSALSQADAAENLDALFEQARPEQAHDVRLKALDRLTEAGRRDPQRVLDELAPYANDKDAKIRNKVIVAIGLSGHERLACPLLLLEAFEDPDAAVRGNATAILSLYEKYPPGAVPLLLKAMKSEHVEVRQSIPAALKSAGGKTPEVLAALKSLFDDPHPLVANNARVSHFELTDDLHAHVPYLLHLTRDREQAEEGAAAEAGEYDDFLAISGAFQIYELSRLRAAELVPELLANLQHDVAAIRQCALRHLRAMCIGSRASYRAVRRSKPNDALDAVVTDPDEKVRIWAEVVRQLLKEGPPPDAPRKLKPLLDGQELFAPDPANS